LSENIIMTFNEFKTSWEENIKPCNPQLRVGQSLMVYLCNIWVEEYKRLSSVHYYDETNIDCFYNDDLIQNTLNHLEKVWINYPK
jgi:hypothetical protein